MTQDMSKDNRKQHTRQCEVRNLLTVSPSASDSLFPSRELRLCFKVSHSLLASLFRYAAVVLLMMVGGSTGAWGQDFSGFWYIANNTNHAEADISKRWYIVPAKDPQATHYADAYFHNEYCNKSGKGDYTGENYGDPEKPFITTYHTSRDLNSVWIVVPTDDGYYHIIHAMTGKYIVYEPPYKDATHRKAIHLESITGTPGENAKFTISGSLTGAINIQPKTVDSNNSSFKYFNPSGGNKSVYYGAVASDTDTDYYRTGMVSLWSASNGDSQWYFEGVPPYFVYTSENKIKIIYPDDDATIYYTTDGTDPVTSETREEYKGDPFDPDDGQVIIRAIAKTDSHQSAEGSSILPCSSSPYLMQNVECTDFYMIPGDLNNNETEVHTTSLGRPTMQWYFKPAGMDNNYQYFYIPNNRSKKGIKRCKCLNMKS